MYSTILLFGAHSDMPTLLLIQYLVFGAHSDTCTFQNASNLILLLARKIHALALQ